MNIIINVNPKMWINISRNRYQSHVTLVITKLWDKIAQYNASYNIMCFVIIAHVYFRQRWNIPLNIYMLYETNSENILLEQNDNYGKYLSMTNFTMKIILLFFSSSLLTFINSFVHLISNMTHQIFALLDIDKNE